MMHILYVHSDIDTLEKLINLAFSSNQFPKSLVNLICILDYFHNPQ
jgi:hypothetical protein